jgi:hypothetical protein
LEEGLNPLTSFLKGYKPAFICNIDETFSKDILAQLNKRPHTLHMDMGRAPQHIYFLSQQFKDHFLVSIDGLERSSPEFDYQLGLVLGYPEKAARFYRDRETDESLTWFRICVEYCGIQFVCNLNELVEVIYELWSLPIPEFEDKMIEVVYYPGHPPLTYHFRTEQNAKKAQKELEMLSGYRRSNYVFC